MDIYKITNVINNKIYIGKAKNFLDRFEGHKQDALKGSNKCPRLYNAMRKYGIENFVCEKIDEKDSLEQINVCEQLWIETLNSRDDSIGYNIASGGDGGNIYGCLDDNAQKAAIKKISEFNSNSVYINNGLIITKINKDLLDDYISKGWTRGYTEKAKENASKAHLGLEPWNKGKKCPRKNRKRNTTSKEELYELYVIKQMKADEIGKIYGVSGKSIRRWLKDFSIEVRRNG